MSFIVVVPPARFWRSIKVFVAVDPEKHWDLYEAIQKVTDSDTRVTVAHCDEAHLSAWMQNNVEPTWIERNILKRTIYSLSRMVAP